MSVSYETYKTALVVGADGMIGSALCTVLNNHNFVVRTTSRRHGKPENYLNLSTPPENWPPVWGGEGADKITAPDIAFLCAGVTGLKTCAEDPQGTRYINVEQLSLLARHLMSAGTRVIFLSTNLVFDGSRPFQPSDTPYAPQCEYGRQKAETERNLLASPGNCSVVRLTKVLGKEAPLLATWVNALRANQMITPFSDMVMAPLPVTLVANLLVRIACSNGQGIYQLCGERDISYAEAACILARHLHISDSHIQPCSASATGVTPEAMPQHTTLADTRVRQEFDFSPPPVRDVLIDSLSFKAEGFHSKNMHPTKSDTAPH